MQSSSWISVVGVLAIALGLAVASCTTQRSATLIKGKALPHKQQARTSTSKEPGNTQAKIQVAYAHLPLHFEPNQGQTDEPVHFLSRGRGYTLFLTSTEAVLALRKPHKNSLAPVSGLPTPTENSLAPVLGERVRVRGPDSEPPEQTVLRMKLLGANPNPRIEAMEELPGKVNYFIGNDPTKWHTNIPTYAKVKYQDAYPGVDLIYYGSQRQLEYDFVVAPGANPGVIQLAFDGLVGAGMPPHPIPLVAQPSWLRAGWKPAPLGERGPMRAFLLFPPLRGKVRMGVKAGCPYELTTTVISSYTPQGARSTCTNPISTRRSTVSNNPSPAATSYSVLSPHHSSLFKWPPTTPPNPSSSILCSPTPPTSAAAAVTKASTSPWILPAMLT